MAALLAARLMVGVVSGSAAQQTQAMIDEESLLLNRLWNY